jgi:periplasmic protein TonB
MRFPLFAALALIVVFCLFWLMQWMIAPPDAPLAERREVPGVELVRVEPERDRSQEQLSLDEAPPPPPPTPPALARPDLPTMSVPAPSTVAMGDVSVPLSFAGGGSISGSSFGGFARGTGAGGDGFGRGQGFRGREFIPLSTARPRMPQWACDQKIKGWVEVVFTVMPNGRVRDVKIVDADPKGVYEATAIESISNWIYESHSRAREVKQRVEMDPADCAFDWR